MRWERFFFRSREVVLLFSRGMFWACSSFIPILPLTKSMFMLLTRRRQAADELLAATDASLERADLSGEPKLGAIDWFFEVCAVWCLFALGRVSL